MAKNKKTPRQQMKYFRVGGLKIRARTARVARRKYLRGNYAHDGLVADLELDNWANPCHETPSEAKVMWKKLYKSLRAEARAKISSARPV